MNTFSAQVKKELGELNNLANKNIVKAELSGYLLTSSSEEFLTESKYNINRFGKLLSNLYINDYKIDMRGNNFVIVTKKNSLNDYFTYKIDMNDIEQQKSLVRGAFMGAGTVTDPKGNYHLEIVFEKRGKC